MFKTMLPYILVPGLALFAACDDGGSSDAAPDAGPSGKADGVTEDDKHDEADAFEAETAEILAALEAGGAARQFNYCALDGTDDNGDPSVGLLKCRSLFLYENDAEMFRISFINGAGLGGASEYAMRNDDGTYRLYVDTTLDGTPEVSGLFEENQEQDVEFDKNGFPTITNMTLHLSATSFALVDLSFGETEALLDGIIIDEAAGTEGELHLSYRRM